MSDDKAIRGPADAKRINVHEDYEIAYWTRTFGVSAQELIAAVDRVGVMADDVQAELEK